MRQSLQTLVEKTLIFNYDLPNHSLGILKSPLSTENDKCYSASDSNSLSEIIYNSIVEYSFNEFEIEGKDFNKLHFRALKTKLKYNENADEKTKLKYGFYGETILYCILYIIYKARPLISRGYFYNPLESSETKGYDSYHLIENKESVELWFGEVKFRSSHTSGIEDAIDNIEKAISDDYLEKNFLAMTNHKNDLNIKGSIIEKIISEWEEEPEISIMNEIKKHNLKLVYPIIILYDSNGEEYNENIKKVVDHVRRKYSSKTFNITIEHSIYFIWLPVEKVREIKNSVIEWIESKRPLLS